MDWNKDHIVKNQESKASANSIENEEVNYSTGWEMPPVSQFAKDDNEESSEEIDKEQVVQGKEIDTGTDSPSNDQADTNGPVIKSVHQLAPPALLQRKEDGEEEIEEEKSHMKVGPEFSSGDDIFPSDTGNNRNSNSEAVKQLKTQTIQRQENRENGISNDLMSNMEQTIGTNLSNVNIHTNSSKAKDVGALAYTQGDNVHFAPGQFNPNTSSGQELIGHEMTHVKQQRDGKVNATTQSKGIPVNDDPGLEKEADTLGAKAANNAMVSQNKLEAKNSNSSSLQLKKAVDKGHQIESQSVSNSVIQRDPPVIQSGTTRIVHANASNDISGTYRAIYRLLEGPEEDGSISPRIEMFDDPPRNDAINVEVVVTLTKTMPNWTSLPAIRRLAADQNQSEDQRSYYQRLVTEWDRFYTSLNAHEERHKAIDVQHYTNIHRRLDGMTIDAAFDEISVVEGEANTDHVAFHADASSAIYSLPWIQQPAERRAPGDERDTDVVQYKQAETLSPNSQNKAVQQNKSKSLQSVVQKSSLKSSEDQTLENESEALLQKADQIKSNQDSTKGPANKILQKKEDTIQRDEDHGSGEPSGANQGNEAGNQVVNEGEESETELKDEEVKIRGGSTTLTPGNDTYEMSGTYDEIKEKLMANAGTIKGGGAIKTVPKLDFETNTDNTDKAIVTVTITKVMPVWTNFPDIKKKAANKNEKYQAYYKRVVSVWEAYLKSLSAHEDGHVKDDTEVFTDAHTKLQNLTHKEAGKKFDNMITASDDHIDKWHAKKESAIMDLPYIQKEVEKVGQKRSVSNVSGLEREVDDYGKTFAAQLKSEPIATNTKGPFALKTAGKQKTMQNKSEQLSPYSLNLDNSVKTDT